MDVQINSYSEPTQLCFEVQNIAFIHFIWLKSESKWMVSSFKQIKKSTYDDISGNISGWPFNIKRY